jgi:hypothetical protein
MWRSASRRRVDSTALAVLDDIRAGIRLREAGKADEARAALESLWPDVEAGGDAFARCFLAHSLADVQLDPQEELRWDLVALTAAEEVTEQRAAQQGIPGGRLGLYPSLHLNLAKSYLRVGDDIAARNHYVAGRQHLGRLADDSYGQSLRLAFAEYEALHPEHVGVGGD